MENKYLKKYSQRRLTSTVPVANKPCAEFMSQTLFSLKSKAIREKVLAST